MTNFELQQNIIDQLSMIDLYNMLTGTSVGILIFLGFVSFILFMYMMTEVSLDTFYSEDKDDKQQALLLKRIILAIFILVVLCTSFLIFSPSKSFLKTKLQASLLSLEDTPQNQVFIKNIRLTYNVETPYTIQLTEKQLD